VGKAQPVVPGEDSFEKLKHQIHFLHERGLTTPQMDESNRQFVLLDRLAGKGRLDPQLLQRLNAKLANETMAQLKATELLYEWLDAWEARNQVARPSPEPDSTVVEHSLASILRTEWSDTTPTSGVPVSRRGLP